MIDFHGADNDLIHEEVSSLSPLAKALTEGRKSPPPINPWTMNDTLEEIKGKYESRSSSELLSCDQVGEQLSDPDLPLGIDRLSLSFLTSKVFANPPVAWEETRAPKGMYTKVKHSVSLDVLEGKVYLQVIHGFTGRWVWVDFNPSALKLGKKSPQVLPVEEIWPVIERVIDTVSYFVDVSVPIEEMFVSRIDVTQSVWRVADMQRLLAIVEECPFNHRVKSVTTKHKRLIETVAMRTKKSGGFSVYDKTTQARLSVPVARFEVCARKRIVKRHCRQLKNLDQAACRKIFDYYLGKTIKRLQELPRLPIDDILADKKDAKALIEMLGIGALREMGHHYPVSKYAERNKYRPLLQRFGAVSMGHLIETLFRGK